MLNTAYAKKANICKYANDTCVIVTLPLLLCLSEPEPIVYCARYCTNTSWRNERSLTKFSSWSSKLLPDALTQKKHYRVKVQCSWKSPHTSSTSLPATTGSLKHTEVFKLLYFRNSVLWIWPPMTGSTRTSSVLTGNRKHCHRATITVQIISF